MMVFFSKEEQVVTSFESRNWL